MCWSITYRGGGVIDAQLALDVIDHRLDLPQCQPVHRVTLRTQQRDERGLVDPLRAKRHHPPAQRVHIRLREQQRIVSNVPEAHAAPERAREIGAHAGALGELRQGECDGRPENVLSNLIQPAVPA